MIGVNNAMIGVNNAKSRSSIIYLRLMILGALTTPIFFAGIALAVIALAGIALAVIASGRFGGTPFKSTS